MRSWALWILGASSAAAMASGFVLELGSFIVAGWIGAMVWVWILDAPTRRRLREAPERLSVDESLYPHASRRVHRRAR